MIVTREGQHGWVWDGGWEHDRRALLATAGSDALVWSLRPAHLKSVKVSNTLWDALGGEADNAYRAQCLLLDDPRAATKLFRDKQSPATGNWDVKQIRRLVAELDSNSFRQREEAMKEIRQIRRLAIPSLREGRVTAGA